mgnify:FL=1
MQGRAVGRKSPQRSSRAQSFFPTARRKDASPSCRRRAHQNGQNGRTVRLGMSVVRRTREKQTDANGPVKRRGTRHARQTETPHARILRPDGSASRQVQDARARQIRRIRGEKTNGPDPEITTKDGRANARPAEKSKHCVIRRMRERERGGFLEPGHSAKVYDDQKFPERKLKNL